MAKKKKNHFATHDFELARQHAALVDRDLHMDLKITIDRLNEKEIPISAQGIADHSPWIAFLKTEAAKQWIPKKDQALRDHLTEAARDSLRWLLFFGYGEQNFRLWPALAEALLATEFRCPRELLKLPYPFLTLQIPRTVGRTLMVRNEDGTEFPASTIFVGLGMGEDSNDTCLSVHIVSEHPGEFGIDGEPGNKYHFLINMANTPDILDEEWILQNDCTTYDVDRQDKECLRLTLNALLYISTPSADVIKRDSEFDGLVKTYTKHPKPRQKMKRAAILRGASMVRHNDTGKSVKIPHIAIDGNMGNHGTFKINSKFLVRGHWRNQPFGIDRSERKLIWIRPFFKGTGLPEVKGRNYDVSES